MSHRRFPYLLRASLVAVSLLTMAAAQDLDDMSALVPESLAAMKAERWDEALKLLTQATALKPTVTLRSYGPPFGVVWYRRGICEMKLKRWDQAISSFETCYRDYPNRGPSDGNLYQAKALLKWGEAAAALKQWDVTIQRFRKFLDERDKVRDTFPQGAFYLTLGICHYRLGHIPEGNEQLEIAIRNRDQFPTTDQQIVAGVQALVGTAISGKNEAAMLDFLIHHREALTFEPYRGQNYAAIYLKLGSDAETAAMYRAAAILYSLVTDPALAIRDLDSRVRTTTGTENAELSAALKYLQQNAASETPIGLLKLAGLTSVQEILGETQTAYELREQIERDFPKSAMHPENLHRLAHLRFRRAEASEKEGKPDEIIAAYEKAWMDGTAEPGPSAPALKRWMELLLERNHPGDPLSAFQAGLTFLEAVKNSDSQPAAEDSTTRDEIAKLTKAIQAQLSETTAPTQ
jgi:tetratricopeptide (TPR) repeat protein